MRRSRSRRSGPLRTLLPALAACAVVLGAAGRLSSEQFSLATYYPAPSGVYTNMITTGNTFLARDGGAVGVATAAPQPLQDGRSVALHVNRNIIANDVYLSAPASGLPRWASQAGQPALSPEYTLMRPAGASQRSLDLGVHDACFVTGFRTWADDSDMQDGCRVNGSQNAPWQLVVRGHREDASQCSARCLDW